LNSSPRSLDKRSAVRDFRDQRGKHPSGGKKAETVENPQVASFTSRRARRQAFRKARCRRPTLEPRRHNTSRQLENHKTGQLQKLVTMTRDKGNIEPYRYDTFVQDQIYQREHVELHGTGI
jgi:hypothetical protein